MPVSRLTAPWFSTRANSSPGEECARAHAPSQPRWHPRSRERRPRSSEQNAETHRHRPLRRWALARLVTQGARTERRGPLIYAYQGRARCLASFSKAWRMNTNNQKTCVGPGSNNGLLSCAGDPSARLAKPIRPRPPRNTCDGSGLGQRSPSHTCPVARRSRRLVSTGHELVRRQRVLQEGLAMLSGGCCPPQFRWACDMNRKCYRPKRAALRDGCPEYAVSVCIKPRWAD